MAILTYICLGAITALSLTHSAGIKAIRMRKCKKKVFREIPIDEISKCMVEIEGFSKKDQCSKNQYKKKSCKLTNSTQSCGKLWQQKFMQLLQQTPFSFVLTVLNKHFLTFQVQCCL